ncbi:hypothetical protein BGW36DRAFT_360922 [Talaromyces proteolyticus]|uniref:Mannosidase Ig/CBM-like domain-containing protein n=1 Tax=Talaromyces proteolyticus TaxID=1131652 RepID=A0AAD4PUL0_9EURO|nr:uncharacterized protein BGW36DRAFT_360922 [Talaromyces proteolyticus]KAH8695216.1 hypothetical protein BGW36DRAFT_360922 [Talaromyces proteolyticus]
MYAVSDLWNDVSGEASWEWIDYNVNPIHQPPDISYKQFNIGTVNSTVLTTINITELNTSYNIVGLPEKNNALLVANLSVTATQPNARISTKTHYSHLISSRLHHSARPRYSNQAQRFDGLTMVMEMTTLLSQ